MGTRIDKFGTDSAMIAVTGSAYKELAEVITAGMATRNPNNTSKDMLELADVLTHGQSLEELKHDARTPKVGVNFQSSFGTTSE